MSSVVSPMPRYRCHKEVSALVINGLEYREDGSATIAPGDGVSAFAVDALFVRKHIPPRPDAEEVYIGGYYVVYEDGYASFSPKKAFEDGYTRLGSAEAAKRAAHDEALRRAGLPPDSLEVSDEAEQPYQPTTFVQELAYLLNKHSMENGSNTPDFILAGFLASLLITFNSTVLRREQWYGRDTRTIGGPELLPTTPPVPPSER